MTASPKPLTATEVNRGKILALFLFATFYVVALSFVIRMMAPEVQYGAIKALPDLTVLMVALAPGWLLVSRFPKAGIFWATLVTATWMLAYASQLQFLVKTGTFASRPLLLFALSHLDDVTNVALSGADHVLLMELFLAGLLIGLGLIASPLHQALMRSPTSLAAGGLVVIVAFGALLLPFPGGALAGPLLSARFSDDLPRISDSDVPKYKAPQLLSTEVQSRPNIVIWIIESGRADLIDLEAETPYPPFINQLARESVVFDRAYTTTSHTSKALVGILCGHYPHPDMRIIEAVPGRLPHTCLPKLLKQLGYESHFIQAALGAFENRRGLTANMGFDHTIVREDLDPSFKKAGYLGMDERALLEPLQKAAASSAKSPVFITLLTNLTHHPYAMPGQSAPEEIPPHAYGTAVEYVDAFLKEAYERMGQKLDWNDTVLVIVGDHGEAFGEHGLQQHDSVSYEEVIRTPMLIRYPSALKPRKDTGLRQAIDIMPSLLQLLGAKWEGSIIGKSALERPGHSHVVTTCWPTKSCHSVVFENKMKVVFQFGAAPEMVFNLQTDPVEELDQSNVGDVTSTVFEASKRIAEARFMAEQPYH